MYVREGNSELHPHTGILAGVHRVRHDVDLASGNLPPTRLGEVAR